MIEWNKVTWYSKIIALLVCIALPFIGFYLGVKFQEAREAAQAAHAGGPAASR